MAAADRANGDHRDRTGGETLSAARTAAIVQILTGEAARCTETGDVHRFDCYKWMFRSAHGVVHGNRSYATITAALESVDRALARFVRDHGDWRAPIRFFGFQIYRPIRSDAVAGARAATEDALAQAQAILTRAPEAASPAARDHIARISAAIAALRGAI
ncbi:MAG: hypothetical protein ACWA5A_08100 [Marinibacterium sp.]